MTDLLRMTNPLSTAFDVLPAEKSSGTALVVEDQYLMARLLSRILKRVGMTVVEATTAEEALGLRWPRGLDLLVTDVLLPGRTGIELAATLRRANPELPVLLCSGYPDHQGEIEGLGVATMGFLGKPFTPVELVAELRQLLKRR